MKKHISSLSLKRDREALAVRRRKAIGLYKKGWSQYKIAKEFRVSFEAVSNWVEDYEAKGREGIESKGNPGPKPLLDDTDKKLLKKAILKGPASALGYSTNIWTLERISKLIKKTTKVKFHPGHVWKIVINLGFSCQKPKLRAKERDEKAIREWQYITLPRLKKMGSNT